MVNEHTKVKAICEALRRDLQCGRPSSRPLPSERALMRRFAAARETVRRALGELQAEGLVVRRVGKGTFPSKRARLMPGRIGLIVLSYAEIFAPICAEIARLCRERSIELLFGDVSALDYTARAEQALRFARDFVERRVSGVILQPIGFVENAVRINAETRGLFEAANVPVVLLDSFWPDGQGEADVVGIDNNRWTFSLRRRSNEDYACSWIFWGNSSQDTVLYRYADEEASCAITNTWFHIALTHEPFGADGRDHWTLFLNGDKVGESRNFGSVTNSYVSHRFDLVARRGNQGNQINAVFDYWRISDKVLEPSEFLCATPAPSERPEPTIGYWPIDSVQPGLANLADAEYPLEACGTAVAQPGCARPSIPNRNALTNLVGAARKNRGSYAVDMWRVSTLAYDDPKDFLYARPRGMSIRIK